MRSQYNVKEKSAFKAVSVMKKRGGVNITGFADNFAVKPLEPQLTHFSPNHTELVRRVPQIFFNTHQKRNLKMFLISQAGFLRICTTS